MNTVEFLDSGKVISYPGKVSELAPDQYLEFCRLFCDYVDDKLSIDEFMIGTLYMALRMTPAMQLASKESSMKLALNIERLIGSLGGFWKEIEYEGIKLDVVDWTFNDQKLPFIKVGKRKFIGPSEGLVDLTYGEYDSAHRNFTLFVKTQNKDYLNALVAVLYRPQKFNWRFMKYKRQHLKDVDAEPHLLQVGNLPYHVKFAVFKWWGNMEDFIRTAQIPTESGMANLSELFEADETSEPSSVIDATGNRGVLYSLAESAVFGNVEKTEETLFWDAMLRIYHLKKTADRQKEHFEKMKNGSTGK